MHTLLYTLEDAMLMQGVHVHIEVCICKEADRCVGLNPFTCLCVTHRGMSLSVLVVAHEYLVIAAWHQEVARHLSISWLMWLVCSIVIGCTS